MTSEKLDISDLDLIEQDLDQYGLVGKEVVQQIIDGWREEWRDGRIAEIQRDKLIEAQWKDSLDEAFAKWKDDPEFQAHYAAAVNQRENADRLEIERLQSELDKMVRAANDLRLTLDDEDHGRWWNANDRRVAVEFFDEHFKELLVEIEGRK